MNSNGGRAKIFVVDDDADVRDSIKILLEVHGFDVEGFRSIDDFIRHYERPARACLILDQHLPGITGLAFLTSCRGRQLGIPIILITGRGDLPTARAAREAGAEYLEKPIGPKRLVEIVSRMIQA